MSPTKPKPYTKEIIMPNTTSCSLTITTHLSTTNTAYTILSTLGKGSKGTVFLAHDQQGKRVAIKQSNDPDHNTLERERTILTMLQEEPIAGIAHLLNLTMLDGKQSLVLEYIEGQPARSMPAHALSTPQVIAAITDFYRLLAHLHQRGIAHYDLHDGNLLWTPQHRIAVIDFGAARIPELDDVRPFRMDVIDMLFISGSWLRKLVQDPDCPRRKALHQWTEDTLDALYGPLTLPASAVTLLQQWEQVVQQVMPLTPCLSTPAFPNPLIA
jgi:serine/threonine protein kinase